METEKEVRTIEINLKCPDCEIILELESNWKLYGCYKYKCRRCNSIITSDKIYPYIKYINK